MRGGGKSVVVMSCRDARDHGPRRLRGKWPRALSPDRGIRPQEGAMRVLVMPGFVGVAGFHRRDDMQPLGGSWAVPFQHSASAGACCRFSPLSRRNQINVCCCYYSKCPIPTIQMTSQRVEVVSGPLVGPPPHCTHRRIGSLCAASHSISHRPAGNAWTAYYPASVPSDRAKLTCLPGDRLRPAPDGEKDLRDCFVRSVEG